MRIATEKIPLRPNAVDPCTRKNTGDNTGPGIPAIHVRPGDKLTVTVLPKGAGSENVSRIGMLLPTRTREVEQFIVETVALAGGRPCPPVILGVGIGSTFDGAAALSKEALLLPIDTMDAFERKLCDAVNTLGIGPDGARRRHNGPCREGEERRLPYRIPPRCGERPVLGMPAGNKSRGGKEVIDLTTPLGDEVLSLRAGDRVTLTGIVYTARDEAHLRMQEEGIPFNPRGAVIYHCGPVVAGERIIAAGPTTSARMDSLTGFLIDAGVRGIIGKGGMGREVVDLLRGKAVYLAFTGGCAALAASRMCLKGVHFPDLGMAEAVWVIEVDHLPLVVGIDAHGNDLFGRVREEAKAQCQARFHTL